jgi:NTE family protein
VIERRFEVPTGQPFDQESFDKGVMKLYGLDYFGVMRDDYEVVDGKGVLSLDVPKKPYGKNSLQFGVSFRDDFSGDANYAFSLRHLLLAANRRGGEWENVGQIGQTRLLRTTFYQPLDYGMRWFVSPSGETSHRTFYLWDDGQPVSEGALKTNLAQFSAGRVFGDSAEARLSAYYANSDGKVIIGEPLTAGADSDERDAGLQLTLSADSRDSVVFPRKGVEIQGWYRKSQENFGADFDRQIARLDASIAMTIGRVTVVPSFSGQTLVSGPLTFQALCELGGFLNLSGLGTGELRGERCVVGRTMAYIELSRLDFGPLTSAVYGGLSFEAGNVYFRDDEPVTWDSLLTGGSLFVGAQTPIGPAYVAWGTTDSGDHRLYFVIGDRF